MSIHKLLISQEGTKEYYINVLKDIEDIRKNYPFTKILFVPTKKPTLLGLEVITVNRDIIRKTFGKEEDFDSEYSKKAYIVIPLEYKIIGCDVYAGNWIEESLVLKDSRHFYERMYFGEYRLCVGVPEEMRKSKNMILENIRTTENMLIEYEKIMKGDASEYDGLAYSHGEEGIDEYRRKKHRRL